MAAQVSLVTGRAGFFGSELVRQLAVHGARTNVVVHLANGRRQNLDGIAGEVGLHVADIRDAERMAGLLTDHCQD